MTISKIVSELFIDEAQKKITTIEALEQVAQMKCIYTKGVFDILHYGHMALFNYLFHLKTDKNLSIVIGVTSDKQVKEKKGSNRPINPEENRLKQIALIPFVDYVYIHDEPSYERAISFLKPAYYIKGMDTAANEVEADKYNPEISELDEDASFIIFADNSQISTTDLILKIKKIQ